MSIKELEKLSKLKEQGIISNEEFEREKKKLLNGNNKQQSNTNTALILTIVIVVVIFVLPIIAVMGISGYSQASSKINRNKVVEDVTRMVQEMRGLYAGKADIYAKVPAGSETDDLLLSIGFRKPSDRHPFGGVYYITPANETDSDGAKRYFNVNITGLNGSDCFYICTSDWEGLYEDCDTTQCSSDTNNTLTLSLY